MNLRMAIKAVLFSRSQGRELVLHKANNGQWMRCTIKWAEEHPEIKIYFSVNSNGSLQEWIKEK